MFDSLQIGFDWWRSYFRSFIIKTIRLSFKDLNKCHHESFLVQIVVDNKVANLIVSVVSVLSIM